MVGFINWLKGYLQICVSGLAVERFINLCGHRNIMLWDVVRKNDAYVMYISLKAFWDLRPIVRKTGTKVVILQRNGLPFFISRMNKRKIFLLGCFLSVFLWYISANFVWKIELDGNYRITGEQIMDYLDAQGVCIGMRKKDLNIELVEKGIRTEFPEIIWTSGKFEGTVFLLSVKESNGVKIRENDKTDRGYDLTAETDGEIYSMIVRKGVPLVKQGDVVTKDTILVEGKVPIKNDDGSIRDYLYVESDADIYIKHEITYQDQLNAKYRKKVYTGRRKIYPYLRIGKKEWTYHAESPYLTYDILSWETTLQIVRDLKIPLFWGTNTYREYQNQEDLYTKEQAEALLQEKFSQFVLTLQEKGVQIIEKDVKIIKNSDTWEAVGKMIIAEPCGTRTESEKD